MTVRKDDVTINRTQALVLGFFLLVWATLVVLFAAEPEVYYRAMKLPSTGAGLLFLVGISVFIVLLSAFLLWVLGTSFLDPTIHRTTRGLAVPRGATRERSLATASCGGA